MNKLSRDRTLSEQAYHALKEMILNMQPGDNRLPSEDDLARSMGVSRATVREALKRLMIDGITTTIHGKGTFAHPSAFSAKNRMDVCSDFMRMLSSQYDRVTVDSQWFGTTASSRFYKDCFGPQAEEAFTTGWLYVADGKPMLYGYYEICPAFLTREVTTREAMISLPQFSESFMRSPIDYCIMTARIGTDAAAQKKLKLSEGQPLLYWEEKIYDIDDHLVATGTVYMHPDNMELSVVTRFEL